MNACKKKFTFEPEIKCNFCNRLSGATTKLQNKPLSANTSRGDIKSRIGLKSKPEAKENVSLSDLRQKVSLVLFCFLHPMFCSSYKCPTFVIDCLKGFRAPVGR